MQVTLLGMGGSAQTLSLGAMQALKQATLLLGASRLLDALPDGLQAEKIACYLPREQMAHIRAHGADTCVVYSGDTGFYSGARGLLPLLRQEHIPYTVLAGVSSVQLLSCALGEPWQDWKLVSAHGIGCDPVCELTDGRDTFFLTDGTNTPDALCTRLAQAGLGQLSAVVGEQLSYPTQKMTENTVQALAQRKFAPLSVLLVRAAPMRKHFAPGIADEAFTRGSVPMTKREVRAQIPALLELQPTDTVWDVGAGTGSVSVELALTAHRGRTYAIECDPEGTALIRTNREAFGAWNLVVCEGRAQAALTGLPSPDAVFLGGTKGGMHEILDVIFTKNPHARVCISAIAVETLTAAIDALRAHGKAAQVTQIAASRSRAVGGLHMMTANNPIYLITGGNPCSAV